MRAYGEEGFPVTIVRPSLTYDPNFPIAIGGWGCYTLADRLKKGLPIIVHGDGTSLWVVTHAEDFGRGFLGLLGNADALGQAFHITSDEVLTWDQIYQTIAEGFGVEAKIVHIPSEFIAGSHPPRGPCWETRPRAWSSTTARSSASYRSFQATHPLPPGHPAHAGLVRGRRKTPAGG